jgi:hypothetical protein
VPPIGNRHQVIGDIYAVGEVGGATDKLKLRATLPLPYRKKPGELGVVTFIVMTARCFLARCLVLGCSIVSFQADCAAQEKQTMDRHSLLWRQAIEQERDGSTKEAIGTYRQLLDSPPMEKEVKGMIGNVFVGCVGDWKELSSKSLDLSFTSAEVQIVELVRDVPPVVAEPRAQEQIENVYYAPKQPGWRRHVFDRLDDLLLKSGDTDAWVQNRLRSLEGPWGLVDFHEIAMTCGDLSVRGQSEKVQSWRRHHLAAATGPEMSRAYLLLMEGRASEATEALEKHWSGVPPGTLYRSLPNMREWLEKMDPKRTGTEQGVRLAHILVKLAPETPEFALYMLLHRTDPDDASTIVPLEVVLKPESRFLFGSGGKTWKAALKNGNPMELASRLRSLYLAAGRTDALGALNQRVRKREAPFDSTAYINPEDRTKVDAALAAW